MKLVTWFEIGIPKAKVLSSYRFCEREREIMLNHCNEGPVFTRDERFSDNEAPGSSRRP